MRACRRRWRWLAALAGLLSSAMVFLVALLVVLVLGREVLDSTIESRWFPLAIVVATTALAILLRVVWPLVRAIPMRAVARAIEERCPTTRGLFVSAVELGALVRDAQLDSLGMRYDVQRRAGESAEGISPVEVYPFSRSPIPRLLSPLVILMLAHVAVAFVPGVRYVDGLREFLLPFAAPLPAVGSIELVLPDRILARGEDLHVVARVRGTAATSAELHREASPDAVDEPVPSLTMTERAAGVFETELAGVQETMVLYATAGALESERHEVHVSAPPVVVSFQKRILPPEYLGDEPIVRRESHGHLQVLEGASVELDIETSQELAAAHLQVEFDDDNREDLSLRVHGRIASLRSFAVTRSGRYRVVLTARETALVNRWSPLFDIRVDHDRPPTVSVEGPEPDALVRSDSSVDVRVVARDDFGMASVTQRLAVNGQNVLDTALVLGADTRVLDWAGAIDLGMLAFETGDRCSLSFRARDLKGNVSDSREIALRVYHKDALLVRTDLATNYRQAANELRTLHRTAVNVVALWEPRFRQPKPKRRPSSEQTAQSLALIRQRIASWVETAESCLGHLAAALAASQDARTRATLWRLHAGLRATLEEQVRLAGVLLDEMQALGDESPALTQDVPRLAFELWANARSSVEGLARDVVPLLLDHELVTGLHGTLVRISRRVEERLTRTTTQEADFRSTLFELKSQLRSVVSFPEDLLDAAGDRKILRHVRTECERLLESVETTQVRPETYDWKILGVDIRQILFSMSRNIPKLHRAANDTRERHRARPASRDGDAIRHFLERARKTLPSWEGLLLQARRGLDAPPATTVQQLKSSLDEVVQARDPRIRRGDQSWRLDIVQRQARWTHAAVNAHPVLSARYAHDLFVLGHVFDVIRESARSSMLGDFVAAVSNHRPTAMLDSLGPLLSQDHYVDPIVEQLDKMASAVVILELSRDLGNVHDQARELLRADERRDHLIEGLRTQRVERYEDFFANLEALEERALERQVLDLEATVRRIRDSVESTMVRSGFRSRGRPDVQTADRGLLFRRALKRVEERLAFLAAEETPSIHAARERLQAMLSDPGTELEELVGRAQQSHDETKALEDSLDRQDSEATEEELSRLYDQETRIEQDIDDLRQALSNQAASLDLADAEDYRRARDLDAAALALEETSPAVSDVLLAAAAYESFREEALKRILARQRQRLETLSTLQDHLSHAGSESSPSGDLARELGVDDELDRLYREVESIRAMKETQQNLTEEVEAHESEGDESVDRLTRQQEELQNRVEEMLEQSRDGQNALDDRLDRSLESLRDEVDVHHRTQVRLNQKRQQEAVELRADQSRIRSEIESLEREIADLHSDELERLERQLRREFAAEAESIAEIREELQDIESEVGAARQRVVDNPEETLEGLARSEKRLAQVKKKIQGVLERTDPIAPQKRKKVADSGIDLRRALAVQEVDALRHRERRLARESEIRVKRRAAQDRRQLEAQDELRTRLSQIAARRGREENPEQLAALEDEDRRIDTALERLNQHDGKMRDERTAEDAKALKARERLVRDMHGTARVLEGFAKELRKGSAAQSDFSLARKKVTLAGQRLERDSRIRVHEDLDQALAALGADRGDNSESVDATAMGRDRLHDLEERGRRLRRQLNALEQREQRSRKDLLNGEIELRARLGQSYSRLESIESLRSRGESAAGAKGKEALDAAKRQFVEEVLPQADRTVEWMNRESGRLHAGDSPHLELAERDPGVRLVEALERLRPTLREPGLSRRGERERDARPQIDRKQSPGRASAEKLGEALERMSQAAGALRKKRLGRASGQQRSAEDALAGAVRAAAESVNRGSRSPSSSRPSPGPSGQSDDSIAAPIADGDERGSQSGFMDQELFEAFFGEDGENGRRWYLLPSDLKREILMCKRENIPPRYRARVEAYYRRVAEAAEVR